MKTLKKISIKPDKISILMTRFDCRKVTVYNALAFRRHNQKAKDIRKVALEELGGVENEYKIPA